MNFKEDRQVALSSESQPGSYRMFNSYLKMLSGFAIKDNCPYEKKCNSPCNPFVFCVYVNAWIMIANSWCVYDRRAV